MKIKKLSLKSIKNVLNKDELKKIMAGSGGISPCCACFAYEGSPAVFLYDTISGTNCGQFCEDVGYGLGAPADPMYCH